MVIKMVCMVIRVVGMVTMKVWLVYLSGGLGLTPGKNSCWDVYFSDQDVQSSPKDGPR